ncbi:hypothetical protein ABH922_001671 [Rhodococcus sp. 27YEA15]|uniref:hypothetical protein n=1 Tax=Rhodococcus sp. 27YEA15 TaxID=3156259 RepID=UPI003C7C5016
MRRAGAALASAAAALLTGSAVVLTVGIADARAFSPVTDGFDVLCTPTDPGLDELSGMVVVGDRLYGIGDSGNDDVVLEMGTDCHVHRRIPVPIDPYDVEDLASLDGALVLSDTGDNLRTRTTVALVTMDPDTGEGDLHRLTYPDGPHDAESLLLGPDGRPFIVTKELFGASAVYTPANNETTGELARPGPTALKRVGTVTAGSEKASSGTVGSVLFTGGAVSAGGEVLALRTYTDVYLYRIVDGDVGATLVDTEPVATIPTPAEPQGESVAFTESGDLLIGSEAAGGDLPPIHIARGVVDALAPARDATSSSRHWTTIVWAGLAVGVVGVGLLSTRSRRLRG